jgi:hypothetical protein
MAPELDASQLQIQRIVQSKTFKSSEVHRNLLSYLAEKSLLGEGHTLKEYTVGLDVFGKPASYDPRQESVVRMHVGRLRQKLVEYYRTEGKDDPVIVDLPKGAFTLTFDERAAAIPDPAPRADVPAPPSPSLAARYSRREIALAALLFLAVVVAAFLGSQAARTPAPRTANGTAPAWTPELQQLWAPLLSSERPLMISLATDPFHLSNGGSNTATGGGTANAAFLLGQFIGPRKHNVFPVRSDVLSMGEIAMADVIWVGPTTAKSQIQAIPPVEQPFELTAEGVKNLQPHEGEPAVLLDSPHKEQAKDAKEEFETTYALVSHLPGLYGKGELLYLLGNRVATVTGAVQALTEPEFARHLVGHLKKNDGSLPRYYQVVLRVKAMDDTPLDITYMFHRELTLSKSSLATTTP